LYKRQFGCKTFFLKKICPISAEMVEPALVLGNRIDFVDSTALINFPLETIEIETIRKYRWMDAGEI
jgi:hypothetical protein